MSSRYEFVETRASRSLTAIRFQHVTKTYQLYKNDRTRLLAAFWPRTRCDSVDANHDLSFTIERGEAVAFLGQNGAGKSTALKMISGVTAPTSGRVEIHGRVSALLDLSSGFDMQLTGRENLILRSRLWGMTSAEIAAAMPGIIDFAEIGKYADQPLRTYSSGMRSRLGFALASSLRPDILVLDEVLSVGDRAFSKKSLARMQDIMSTEGVTLLFVTHAMDSARKFCQRGLVIDGGALQYDGPIGQAISYYKKMSDAK